MTQNRSSYQDFELDISQAQNLIHLRQAPTGNKIGDSKITSKFDVSDLVETWQEVANLVAQTQTQAEMRTMSELRLDDITSESEDRLREIGQTLFNRIIPEPSAIRNKYIGSYYLSQGEGKRPLLRLRLHTNENLAVVPWEILAIPPGLDDENRFLVRNLSLSRLPLAGGGALPAYETPYPLRVLLVGDDPFSEETKKLNAQKELIRESLKPLSGRIAVTELTRRPEDNSTLEALKRELKTHNYQIIHFMGHGEYDDQQDPPAAYLTMTRVNRADSETTSFAFYAKDVAKACAEGIGQQHGVRLVVINACESAEGQTSLAQAILDTGIPAAVGMQYEISDPAARVFVTTFYRELAATLSVDTAMQTARQQIAEQIIGTLEWVTPVLFFTGEGNLFQRPLEDPLLTRQTYWRLLRHTTRILDEADYLPVQVTRSTTVVQKPSGNLLNQDGMYVQTDTTSQHPTADALEVLYDKAEKHISCPVNIVLGEIGSGKSTLINQLIGHVVPQNPSIEQLTTDQRELLIPIRLLASQINWRTMPDDDQLTLLIYQGLSDVWQHPQAQQLLSEHKSDPEWTALPTIDSINRWVEDGTWQVLLLVETLEDILPRQRPLFGQNMRQLLQDYPRHKYLITATTNAFSDYVTHLGQNPQWQIAPLSEQVVREMLSKPEIGATHVLQQNDLLIMLRQPWALFTLIKMWQRGLVVSTQSDLLRGRIDQLLQDMPSLQKSSIQKTLIQLALRLEEHAQENEPIPYIAITDLFELMADVRGERTYDLENIFQALVDSGVLATDEKQERVRFTGYHIQAIMAALALDQWVTAHKGNLPTHIKLVTPRLHVTLILFSQLSLRNQTLIAHKLFQRLDEAKMANQWEERLELLELMVRSMGHQKSNKSNPTSRRLIRELVKLILSPADEYRLDQMSQDNYLVGAIYNMCRLSATSKRVRVVRLLNQLRHPDTFEPFRWLIMEQVRQGERCEDTRKNPLYARSGVRRAAGVALFQLWQTFPNEIKAKLTAYTDYMYQLRTQKAANMGGKGNATAVAQQAQQIQQAQQTLQYPALDDPTHSQQPIYPTKGGYLAELLQAWQDYQSTDDQRMGRAFSVLVTWVRTCDEQWLRSMAAIALAEIGGQYSTHHPLRKRAVEILAEEFPQADVDTMWSIADGAGSLSFLGADDTRTLLNTLQQIATATAKEYDYRRRSAAVYALGKLRRPQAIPTLQSIITDPYASITVRARAARSLGECSVDHPDYGKIDEVCSALEAIALDAQPEETSSWTWLRREAVSSLGFIGGKAVVESLLTIIQDCNSNNKLSHRALLALVQVVGREEAAEHLQKQLMTISTKSDKRMIYRLLAGLSELDNRKTNQVLAQRLNNWLISAWTGSTMSKNMAEMLLEMLMQDVRFSQAYMGQVLEELAFGDQ